jgi:hypothetical protein
LANFYLVNLYLVISTLCLLCCYSVMSVNTTLWKLHPDTQLQRKIGLILEPKSIRVQQSFSNDCVAAMRADSNAHFVNASVRELLAHNRIPAVYKSMYQLQAGNCCSFTCYSDLLCLVSSQNGIVSIYSTILHSV